MLRRRFDGKTIGTLFVMIMSVCLSAYASLRSSDAWTLNPSDFRYDMTLYFSTSSKAYENLEAYEIGAFINDECRGLAENLELSEGESCMYMRIRSNSTEADEVVFKMREKATGKITILQGKNDAPFLFKPDEMVGLPSDPYILAPYFSVTIEAGENGTVDFTNGTYAEGTVIEVEAIPAEGYHFEKWSDGVTDAKRTITVEANIDLTATFAVTSYQAVFSIDGEEIATLSVPYGSKIDAPVAPEKEGYTFSGWEGLPETMPAKDIEITGSYNINYYKLTFVIDDVIIEEKEVAYGSEIVAPATPDKEGHSFEGWLNFVSTMPAEDLTIFGSYKANSHLLIYMVDGEIYEEHVVEYGAVIEAPEAPEKEGYTFAGWEGLPETMPAKDLEVTATYTVNSYKAVFKIGDEVIETLSVEYGAAIEAPEVPEKEGYTFAGWSDIPAAMPAEDIEITGSYTLNSYKAVFKIGDEVIETLSVEYGAAIVAPEAPEKEGYTFAGWSDIPAAMPAEDIEITGSYAVNYYSLKVYIDGELYMEETLAYGAEIIIPEPVAPENMKFEGWTEEVPATMPAHEVVINGTMVPDETTSVIGIIFDKDEVINVYNLNGVLLYKDVKANELNERLAPGIYIINGKKVIIR